MTEEYDLLIVGAGTGGSVAAETAAKKGLKACIVDCKPEDEIGVKVCGDAIGGHHFKELGIPPPTGDDFDIEIEGIKLYSPDLSTVFVVNGPGVTGYIVNRHSFGQRLLKAALDSGIKLRDSMLVTKPLIEDGCVRGVLAHNLKDKQKQTLRAKVTIDASGAAAAIRSRLPDEFGIEREVSKKDLMSCYREIRGGVELEKGYCQIYLNQAVAEGGYFWIFPKSEGRANVGVGVQASKRGVHPKTQLYSHIFTQPKFRHTTTLEAGGGYVPTRRPIDCLVGNGVMLVGDAACLVNPIHGGGIGPSMVSGRLAAEMASEAIERSDTSKRGLWRYNTGIMKAYGAKQASLDIFRIFLQETSDEELNFGMKHGLVKESDVLSASMKGDLTLSIPDKAERVLRGLRRPDFLIRLEEVARKMRGIKEHFLNYPTPEEFPAWRARIKTFY